MILVVGASGRLGGHVARMLLAQGKPVRAMSHTPSKVENLKKLGAEVVIADLRDPDSLASACQGVEKVLAAAQAFEGQGDNNPHTVDDIGNRHLIDAAKKAEVKHFVFTSIHDARPNHSVEEFRIKYRVEEYLRASGLSYTILRPTAYMEFWAALVGQPIIEKGKTTIFGRGVNPVNFVSAEDVARFAIIALEDSAARNQIIEIGGPENLSLVQVAEIFEHVTGQAAKKSHVPLPMMRVMAILTQAFNPKLSRQIAAGVYMDTEDQTLDMTDTLKRFPMKLKRLEEVARIQYANPIMMKN